VALLEVDNISKRFGGLLALNDVSFGVEKGEILGIIGPNGAGKTTLFGVVSGFIAPSSGDVRFDGSGDLTRLDEAAIANLGIGRKFQKPTVFESHSVEDNIALALKGRRGAFAALFHRRSAAEQDRIDALLATIRLSDKRGLLAARLSHGQKQWLEIGMLLAQEPRLLLVDEPAAGMTDAETAETAILLKDIARTQSVVVVEHDMTFVRALDVKVTVLHEGSVLAEGSLDAVSANPKVIEVYLGR